jgi:hypothetical protein
MYSTRVVADLLDCMSHQHPALRRAAADCSEIGKYTVIS